MTRTVIVERREMVERCIEACRDCHTACVETTFYCLGKGGAHAEEKHIALLQDCADLGKLSEDTMLRSSDYVNRICQLCADVCEACAESCDRFGDDRAMKACANRCRSCADVCREMTGGSELHARLTSFT
jgi:hypothetical protein